MADNKKYYYLKLKDNFFDDEKIQIIEAMPDGDTYVNILLKLYLRSLKRDGKLMATDRIPYSPETLAAVVKKPVGVVRAAVEIFRQFELVEVLDNGEMYMLDIQNFIGTSSTEGDRKREYRRKIADAKEGKDNKLPPVKNGHLSDERPPEIRDKRLDNIYSSVKPERAKFKYSEKDMKLAEKLKELVSNLYPQTAEKANLESWANQFRLLHESDGYNYREIGEVMLWALNDDFWQKNIRSADKFRKQFEQLKVKSGINIKQPKQNDPQEIDGDFSDIDPMNMQDMFQNRF